MQAFSNLVWCSALALTCFLEAMDILKKGNKTSASLLQIASMAQGKRGNLRAKDTPTVTQPPQYSGLDKARNMLNVARAQFHSARCLKLVSLIRVAADTVTLHINDSASHQRQTHK